MVSIGSQTEPTEKREQSLGVQTDTTNEVTPKVVQKTIHVYHDQELPQSPTSNKNINVSTSQQDGQESVNEHVHTTLSDKMAAGVSRRGSKDPHRISGRSSRASRMDMPPPPIPTSPKSGIADISLPNNNNNNNTNNNDNNEIKPRNSISNYGGVPPPRPTSPPPPEFIQRATNRGSQTISTGARARPMLKNHLSTVSFHSGSVNSRSATPLSSNVSSYRSATPGTDRLSKSSTQSHHRRKHHDSFGTVSNIERRSYSISSSSAQLSERDNHLDEDDESDGDDSVSASDNHVVQPTGPDPIIQAITQTMIGEFLFKYTRKSIGKGNSAKRHRRYFWLHPYNKSLFWSEDEQGAHGVFESSSKSVYIERVTSVEDYNPSPPGLHHESILVYTAQNREIKLTASNRERHELWLNALSYLLQRNSTQAAPTSESIYDTSQTSRPSFQSVAEMDFGTRPRSSMSNINEFGGKHYNDWSFSTAKNRTRTALSNIGMGTTPRANKNRFNTYTSSVTKRSGTPASEYIRTNNTFFDSPLSKPQYTPSKTYSNNENNHNFDSDEEEYEGLDDPRVCCGGRHTVAGLQHDMSHANHQRNRQKSVSSRAGSPFSLRSRMSTASSTWSRRHRSQNSISGM